MEYSNSNLNNGEEFDETISSEVQDTVGVSSSLEKNEVPYLNYSLDQVKSMLAVGQVVANEEVAYHLYCHFAKLKGFSVRKDDELKFKDGSGELKAKDFVCSSQGAKNEMRSTNNVPKYQRSSSRKCCRAKLRIARRGKEDQWKVSVFKNEHSHDMYAPDQQYLLRSARRLTPEVQKQVEDMMKAGISISKILDYQELLVQGRKNLPFTRMDVYNGIYCAKRKTSLEDQDAMNLVQHFIKKSNADPYFYWNVERDDEGRLLHLFFRDYRCMLDYQYFGDVFSFDTTYKTNKYSMIAAPFVGKNNHRQNIMFGFAFLSNEMEDSFEWLFRTFLESMGGKQPETIFTDQCPAMMNAIGTVFPTSRHRLCHWHISQKKSSHFGMLKNNLEFNHLWNKCMRFCDTEEEFESIWKQMMNDYDLGENKHWFDRMYALRHYWATVFSNDRFSAGLLSTSRSESTNRAVKMNFGRSDAYLYDCILDFGRMVDDWRANEREKDTRSHHFNPPMVSSKNPLLVQAGDIYTLEIFSIFNKEIGDCMNFFFSEPKMPISGTSLTLYKMKPVKESSKIFTVEFDSETMSVKCSCRKFETVGLLCAHALRVLNSECIHYIPDRYIKLRWTKSVRNKVCDFHNGNISSDENNHSSGLLFVQEIMRGTYELAAKAHVNQDARNVLTKALTDASKKISWLFQNMSLNDLSTRNDVQIGDDSQVDEMHVHNPLWVKSKGITDVYTRHWDRPKKGKGRAKNLSCDQPKKGKKIAENLGPAKGTKRKERTSQTTRMDHHPSSYPSSFTVGGLDAQTPQLMPVVAQPIWSYTLPFTTSNSASNTNVGMSSGHLDIGTRITDMNQYSY